MYNDLSTNKPSWSTHNAGFSCYYEVEILQSYWGIFNSSNQGRLLKSEFLYCDKNPVSFSTMRQGGSAVIWLRGGGKYYYKTENINTNAVVRTSTFTEGNISVSPTTSPPSMVASIITTDNFTFNGSQLTLGF